MLSGLLLTPLPKMLVSPTILRIALLRLPVLSDKLI
jgi:hypothetical protein